MRACCGRWIYDCAIISRHAGFRIQTDPSPHPSPLGGERVPVGRVRANVACLKIIARLFIPTMSHLNAIRSDAAYAEILANWDEKFYSKFADALRPTKPGGR